MSTANSRPARKARAAAPAVTPLKAKPGAARKASRATPKSVPQAAPVQQVKPTTKAPKKPKPVLVRDGFTMPEGDFALIAMLKKRAAAAGREAKKSELLRAGLQALAALDSPALVTSLNKLETVKVGRPRKGH